MLHVRCWLQEDFASNPKLVDTMFVDRARQFKERLQWDVSVDERGWEVDQYDAAGPLYVMAEGPDGQHLGSGRFMSCRTPTMTEEFFDHLLPPEWHALRHRTFETTRFCISTNVDLKTARNSARLVMAGGISCCVASGVNDIVGVFDRSLARVYRKIGWAPRVIGESRDLALGHWTADPRVLKEFSDVLPAFKVDISIG
ncbi:MAG: acyl-homoserine-lactone synthase, partial [Pseudomonadota bacterium]